MSLVPVRDGGWTLTATTDEELSEVMAWFPDADAVNIWGGPKFRYPFTATTFRHDCHFDEMDTYSLWDRDGNLAAFGQSYEREGRGHLARLVSNPAMRRNGAGKQLIRMIMASLARRHDYDEYSLFVYRHNEPAYRCYTSLGFIVQEYPEGAPMPDKCYFLTRPHGAAD